MQGLFPIPHALFDEAPVVFKKRRINVGKRRDLTIKRLAFAAAFAVDPKVKHAICLTRDALILNWEDGAYTLVYRNLIKPLQSWEEYRKGISQTIETSPEL